jgi:catechol 1,2-dioxygenase
MRESKKNMGRREFLNSASLVAVAISFPTLQSCKEDKLDATKNNCQTTDDILGPFYKAGSPFGENIIPIENTAPPLIIEGKVFTNCDIALKDAVVEVWNANDTGGYDTSTDFKFRGQYKTAADGVYRFKTIIPGRYLNGGTFRPSHIHFRITAPNHQELVSQIYFKDDPFIESDPWAGASKASERILTLAKDANGIDTVTFNIYLNP